MIEALHNLNVKNIRRTIAIWSTLKCCTTKPLLSLAQRLINFNVSCSICNDFLRSLGMFGSESSHDIILPKNEMLSDIYVLRDNKHPF